MKSPWPATVPNNSLAKGYLLFLALQARKNAYVSPLFSLCLQSPNLVNLIFTTYLSVYFTRYRCNEYLLLLWRNSPFCLVASSCRFALWSEEKVYKRPSPFQPTRYESPTGSFQWILLSPLIWTEDSSWSKGEVLATSDSMGKNQRTYL